MARAWSQSTTAGREQDQAHRGGDERQRVHPGTGRFRRCRRGDEADPQGDTDVGARRETDQMAPRLVGTGGQATTEAPSGDDDSDDEPAAQKRPGARRRPDRRRRPSFRHRTAKHPSAPVRDARFDADVGSARRPSPPTMSRLRPREGAARTRDARPAAIRARTVRTHTARRAPAARDRRVVLQPAVGPRRPSACTTRRRQRDSHDRPHRRASGPVLGAPPRVDREHEQPGQPDQIAPQMLRATRCPGAPTRGTRPERGRRASGRAGTPAGAASDASESRCRPAAAREQYARPAGAHRRRPGRAGRR